MLVTLLFRIWQKGLGKLEHPRIVFKMVDSKVIYKTGFNWVEIPF